MIRFVLVLSQERLAKELRERFNLSEKTNGANVYGHFTHPNPRPQTIERYAAILGLSDEQLYVVEHGAVPPDREAVWEDELFRMLEIFKMDFESGTAMRIRDALRHPATRQRVLAAMAAPKSDLFWSRTNLLGIPPFFWPVADELYPGLPARTPPQTVGRH